MPRKMGNLKRTIRMIIKSHKDLELLPFALMSAQYVKPRTKGGVVDRVFDQVIREAA